MTEQSLAHQVVIGVDTHDLIHVAVGVDDLGRRLGDISIATSEAGYEEFLAWACALGHVSAVAMEGTGSYGHALCAILQSRGVRVVEVARPSRRNRRNRGKADLMDAEAAARAFLGGEVTAEPRGSNASVAIIRTLRVARDAFVNQRTQTINQLRALVVTTRPALRETLTGLSAAQLVDRVARFRVAGVASPSDASRFAMRQLARHVRDIDVQVAELDSKLAPLVTGRAPELLAVHGVGIDVAGNVLVAWDNARRIRSEAAFAAVGHTNSSGLSTGHSRCWGSR